MSHNLPLIPEKNAACMDVRPLLREVFRDLDAQPTVTGLLKSEKRIKQNKTIDIHYNEWIQEHSSQREKIEEHVEDLRNEYAQILAQKERFKSQFVEHHISERDKINLEWKNEFGIIQRQDLMPNAFEDIHHQKYQCIVNALNEHSNASTTTKGLNSESYNYEIKQSSNIFSKCLSIQSVSYGERTTLLPPLPSQPSSWKPSQQYIVCEPTHLKFVNFTVGRWHTRRIRIVNLSKYEIRLSVQPPSRSELLVELQNNKGMKLTSGSALELRVRFKPRDVRSFRDELLIRTSLGDPTTVPIACYMQPPLLDVIVPNADNAFPCTCNRELPTSSEVLDLGARLFGEPHRVDLHLHCNMEHASFYIMTEESWCSFVVDEAARTGVVVVGAFCISPVRWKGLQRGVVACRAPSAGLRTVALRVLSSTAVVRPLHVVADAVLFSPEHITLQTPEKDYDIYYEGDPKCPHYVHLGTTFPGQPLASTIHLINNSSVPYSYYWSVRIWDEKLISIENEQRNGYSKENIRENNREAVEMVRVEAMRGVVPARVSVSSRVCAAEAGQRPGTRRTVLMLILTNVPRECISSEYENMIIRMETIEEKEISGLCEAWSRSVCEVLCTQMEVWWEVVPIRFTLQPPALHLSYSTRVKSISLPVEVTQLGGAECLQTTWTDGEGSPRVLTLVPNRTVSATLQVPLPDRIGEYLDTKTYELGSVGGEWRARCTVSRGGCATVSEFWPRLCWLDTQPPSASLTTQLNITNKATDAISWSVKTYEWCSEPSGRICSCASGMQSEGLLANGHIQTLMYEWNAPQYEGCMLRLVQLQQANQYSAQRAALVGCRTLQPRLLLRVMHLDSETDSNYETCKLDKSACDGRFFSVAMVRPLDPLTVGQTSLCHLLVTNITPIATTLRWDVSSAHEDSLHVTFIPDCIDVGPHATVTIKVTLKALAVCKRRLWSHRASVQHSEAYLYLLVDLAIDGRKVVVDVPLNGSNLVTSILRSEAMIKQEIDTKNVLQRVFDYNKLFSEDCFNNDGRNPAKLKEVPPPREIPLCPCFLHSESQTHSKEDPVCLEFRNVPIATLATQYLVIRNVGALSVNWKAVTRRETRTNPALTLLGICGLEGSKQHMAVGCTPGEGQLAPGASAKLAVSVEAGSWGLHYERLLLQIENMEPVLLGVWLEAVGSPLQFALKPQGKFENPPLLSMSTADPERRLHIRNTSSADVLVHTFILRQHELPQDTLPLRLYLRFYDVPKARSYEDGYILSAVDTSQSSLISEAPEVTTGIELLLLEDHGKQDDVVFQVAPSELTIPAGRRATLFVTLAPNVSTLRSAVLLLRTKPLQRFGPNWYRPDAPPRQVLLRVYGTACLQVSREALHVELSALQLPPDSVTRVRKYFRVLNVGDGMLPIKALTEAPWSISTRSDKDRCVPNCRESHMQLLLEIPPRSSVELCAELTLHTCEVFPAPFEEYPSRVVTTTRLNFCGLDDVSLLRMPLTVLLEFPKLRISPTEFDFGSVARGDSRKTYFTVSHTSLLTPMEVLIIYEGDDMFTVSPKSLTLAPNCTGRFYVLYTASGWTPEASGKVRVSAVGLRQPERSLGVSGVSRAPGVSGASGASGVSGTVDKWCTAIASLRASSTADRARALPPHDFTDDAVLLPKTL